MSKSGVFSVLDNVAGVFQLPFFSPSRGSAERAYRDSLTDSASPASKHPADYDLYFIGFYDDELGTLLPAEPELLVRGSVIVDA